MLIMIVTSKIIKNKKKLLKKEIQKIKQEGSFELEITRSDLFESAF